MRISASQLQTKERCDRLWFFTKRMKLPEPQKGATTPGTALHAVFERYLKGEEELYPQDWDVVEEFSGKKTRLTGPERTMVKRLVAAGLEQGIVERGENQEIEFEVHVPVIEGVELVGWIDLLEPGKVTDHKTAKNSRYLKTDRRPPEGEKSKSYLGHDTQMLTYAYPALLEARREGGNPGGIILRHNQFVKDPDEPEPVRSVEVVVSTEEIQDHWVWVQQQAAELLALKEKTSWEGIDGPNREGGCKEYGGCAFARVCGGVETIEEYEQRISEADAEITLDNLFDVVSDRNYNQPARQMGTVFKKLSKSGAVQQSKPEGTGLNGPTETIAQAVVEDEEKRIAPWAVSACQSCGRTGINSKGKACRTCDSFNRAQQPPLPTAQDFNARWDDDEGMLVWDEKAGGTVAPPIKEGDLDAGDDEDDDEPENPDEVTEQPPTKSEQPAEEPPTPKVQEPPTPKQQEPPKKETRGRKKKGITLYVNCLPTKGVGAGDFLRLEDIIQQFGAKLAEQLGKESYWSVDSFQRRDAMASKVEAIVEVIGTKAVVARPNDADTRQLLTALAPYCNHVVEGTQA